MSFFWGPFFWCFFFSGPFFGPFFGGPVFVVGPSLEGGGGALEPFFLGGGGLFWGACLFVFFFGPFLFWALWGRFFLGPFLGPFSGGVPVFTGAFCSLTVCMLGRCGPCGPFQGTKRRFMTTGS